MPPLASIPSLEQIAADPACLRDLQPDALAKLALRAASVQSLIAAQTLLATNVSSNPPFAPDSTLSVTDAARALGHSPRWVWRNKHRLNFVRRVGRRLLISRRGLDAYLAAQLVTRKSRTKGAA